MAYPAKGIVFAPHSRQKSYSPVFFSCYIITAAFRSTRLPCTHLHCQRRVAAHAAEHGTTGDVQ